MRRNLSAWFILLTGGKDLSISIEAYDIVPLLSCKSSSQAKPRKSCYRQKHKKIECIFDINNVLNLYLSIHCDLNENNDL